MGRKGIWLSRLRKALGPETKGKKGQDKPKEKWFGKKKQLASCSATPETLALHPPPLLSPPPPEQEELKLVENAIDEIKLEDSVPAAAEVVADSPVTNTVQVDEEVVTFSGINKFAGKSREEVAAIKIQTAFRGHQARRALRALRGLVRLKLLVEGSPVKRQTTHTLRCMQNLARVQSQIHTRRVRMLEEKQALQKQLLQKHAKELESLQMGEKWDESLQSKEQVEANLLSKYESAMRRERALAYSFSHQQTWKNSLRSTNPMFMNPNNPTWGWSWLERWVAAHPSESKYIADRDPNNDQSSLKGASHGIVKAEISKSYARYQINSDKLSPGDSNKPVQNTNVQSPSTPSKQAVPAARKLKALASPRSSIGGPDDDASSMLSVQSDRPRRHSIAGSSVKDDKSLGSFPSVPSYMVPTKSAKAKSRLQSPSAVDKKGTPGKEEASFGTAKTRLSYPPSPARSRGRSDSVKLDSNLNSTMANGEGA